MSELNLEDITYLAWLNSIRKEGFRPCAIAALTRGGLIGVCGSKKYSWYEFIQGGIEPEEMPAETIEREIQEETGLEFAKRCNFPPKQLTFLFDMRAEMKVKGKLLVDEGETVHSKGKHYIIFAVDLSTNGNDLPKINQDEEGLQYNRCVWVNAAEARKLVKHNPSLKKREIALRAINELISLGLAKE